VSQTNESYIKRKKMINRKISSSKKKHNAPKNTGGILISKPQKNYLTDERKTNYLESATERVRRNLI
jgi:hypothetical protein